MELETTRSEESWENCRTAARLAQELSRNLWGATDALTTPASRSQELAVSTMET
jgi:hypothetical protein